MTSDFTPHPAALAAIAYMLDHGCDIETAYKATRPRHLALAN
ncbi:hypothetical protein [Prescottella agglutinans]|uniref:Uncharacterized protein n=1 Tax=Prescottella agglutinans TaxID=1644129 RepID=A0ABT6MEZ4_9NOCA|nr:hypothetical protein [Prescottella agglutinans]MDH6282887.1 hypothetical protein [Prescottella agglutinans]